MAVLSLVSPLLERLGLDASLAAGLEEAHACLAVASSSLMPTRSALPVAGLKIATLDTWIGIVLLDDAAGGALHRVRLGVLLDHVDAVDEHVLRRRRARSTVPRLPLSRPVDHDDLVAFANLVHGVVAPYRTSGASDTIFMNRSVRSSRVTGPKMRVPIGSSLALSSTAALPSNLTSEPSPRRTPLAVRTTTAL